MDYQQQQNQQNRREIKNPQSALQNVKGPEMNDRDFLNDALSTEKYLTENLNIFVREASHINLYGDLNKILAETHQCTREIFNLMFKKGWYSLQGAERQEIQQVQQQFENYKTQFPFQNITH